MGSTARFSKNKHYNIFVITVLGQNAVYFNTFQNELFHLSSLKYMFKIK